MSFLPLDVTINATQAVSGINSVNSALSRSIAEFNRPFAPPSISSDGLLGESAFNPASIDSGAGTSSFKSNLGDFLRAETSSGYAAAGATAAADPEFDFKAGIKELQKTLTERSREAVREDIVARNPIAGSGDDIDKYNNRINKLLETELRGVGKTISDHVTALDTRAQGVSEKISGSTSFEGLSAEAARARRREIEASGQMVAGLEGRTTALRDLGRLEAKTAEAQLSQLSALPAAVAGGYGTHDQEISKVHDRANTIYRRAAERKLELAQAEDRIAREEMQALGSGKPRPGLGDEIRNQALESVTGYRVQRLPAGGFKLVDPETGNEVSKRTTQTKARADAFLRSLNDGESLVSGLPRTLAEQVYRGEIPTDLTPQGISQRIDLEQVVGTGRTGGAGRKFFEKILAPITRNTPTVTTGQASTARPATNPAPPSRGGVAAPIPDSAPERKATPPPPPRTVKAGDGYEIRWQDDPNEAERVIAKADSAEGIRELGDRLNTDGVPEKGSHWIHRASDPRAAEIAGGGSLENLSSLPPAARIPEDQPIIGEAVEEPIVETPKKRAPRKAPAKPRAPRKVPAKEPASEESSSALPKNVQAVHDYLTEVGPTLTGLVDNDLRENSGIVLGVDRIEKLAERYPAHFQVKSGFGGNPEITALDPTAKPKRTRRTGPTKWEKFQEEFHAEMDRIGAERGYIGSDLTEEAAGGFEFSKNLEKAFKGRKTPAEVAQLAADGGLSTPLYHGTALRPGETQPNDILPGMYAPQIAEKGKGTGEYDLPPDFDAYASPDKKLADEYAQRAARNFNEAAAARGEPANYEPVVLDVVPHGDVETNYHPGHREVLSPQGYKNVTPDDTPANFDPWSDSTLPPAANQTPPPPTPKPKPKPKPKKEAPPEPERRTLFDRVEEEAEAAPTAEAEPEPVAEATVPGTVRVGGHDLPLNKRGNYLPIASYKDVVNANPDLYGTGFGGEVTFASGEAGKEQQARRSAFNKAFKDAQARIKGGIPLPDAETIEPTPEELDRQAAQLLADRAGEAKTKKAKKGKGGKKGKGKDKKQKVKEDINAMSDEDILAFAGGAEGVVEYPLLPGGITLAEEGYNIAIARGELPPDPEFRQSETPYTGPTEADRAPNAVYDHGAPKGVRENVNVFTRPGVLDRPPSSLQEAYLAKLGRVVPSRVDLARLSQSAITSEILDATGGFNPLGQELTQAELKKLVNARRKEIVQELGVEKTKVPYRTSTNEAAHLASRLLTDEIFDREKTIGAQNLKPAGLLGEFGEDRPFPQNYYVEPGVEGGATGFGFLNSKVYDTDSETFQNASKGLLEEWDLRDSRGPAGERLPIAGYYERQTAAAEAERAKAIRVAARELAPAEAAEIFRKGRSARQAIPKIGPKGTYVAKGGRKQQISALGAANILEALAPGRGILDEVVATNTQFEALNPYRGYAEETGADIGSLRRLPNGQVVHADDATLQGGADPKLIEYAQRQLTESLAGYSNGQFAEGVEVPHIFKNTGKSISRSLRNSFQKLFGNDTLRGRPDPNEPGLFTGEPDTRGPLGGLSGSVQSRLATLREIEQELFVTEAKATGSYEDSEGNIIPLPERPSDAVYEQAGYERGQGGFRYKVEKRSNGKPIGKEATAQVDAYNAAVEEARAQARIRIPELTTLPAAEQLRLRIDPPLPTFPVGNGPGGLLSDQEVAALQPGVPFAIPPHHTELPVLNNPLVPPKSNKQIYEEMLALQNSAAPVPEQQYSELQRLAKRAGIDPSTILPQLELAADGSVRALNQTELKKRGLAPLLGANGQPIDPNALTEFPLPEDSFVQVPVRIDGGPNPQLDSAKRGYVDRAIPANDGALPYGGKPRSPKEVAALLHKYRTSPFSREALVNLPGGAEYAATLDALYQTRGVRQQAEIEGALGFELPSETRRPVPLPQNRTQAEIDQALGRPTYPSPYERLRALGPAPVGEGVTPPSGTLYERLRAARSAPRPRAVVPPTEEAILAAGEAIFGLEGDYNGSPYFGTSGADPVRLLGLNESGVPVPLVSGPQPTAAASVAEAVRISEQARALIERQTIDLQAEGEVNAGQQYEEFLGANQKVYGKVGTIGRVGGRLPQITGSAGSGRRDGSGRLIPAPPGYGRGTVQEGLSLDAAREYDRQRLANLANVGTVDQLFGPEGLVPNKDLISLIGQSRGLITGDQSQLLDAEKNFGGGAAGELPPSIREHIDKIADGVARGIHSASGAGRSLDPTAPENVQLVRSAELQINEAVREANRVAGTSPDAGGIPAVFPGDVEGTKIPKGTPKPRAGAAVSGGSSSPFKYAHIQGVIESGALGDYLREVLPQKLAELSAPEGGGVLSDPASVLGHATAAGGGGGGSRPPRPPVTGGGSEPPEEPEPNLTPEEEHAEAVRRLREATAADPTLSGTHVPGAPIDLRRPGGAEASLLAYGPGTYSPEYIAAIENVSTTTDLHAQAVKDYKETTAGTEARKAAAVRVQQALDAKNAAIRAKKVAEAPLSGDAVTAQAAISSAVGELRVDQKLGQLGFSDERIANIPIEQRPEVIRQRQAQINARAQANEEVTQAKGETDGQKAVNRAEAAKAKNAYLRSIGRDDLVIGEGGSGGGVGGTISRFLGAGGGGIGKSLANTITGQAAFLIPMTLVFGGIKDFKEIVKTAEELQITFAKLGAQFETIFGTAAQGPLNEYKSKLLEVAAAYGLNPVEFTKAGGAIYGAFGEGSGVSLKDSNGQIFQGSTELAKSQADAAGVASKLFGIKPQEAVDAYQAIGLTFGIDGKDINDKITYLSQRSGQQPTSLIKAISDSAQVASDAGFGFNEFASLITTVGQRKGERAAAGAAESINRALPGLAKQVPLLTELGADNDILGKDPAYLQALASGNTRDIFLQLASKYSKLAPYARTQVENIFGQRNIKDISAAFAGGETAADYTKSLDSGAAQGASGKALSDVMSTWAAQLSVIKTRFLELGEALNKSGLFDILTDVLKVVGLLFLAVEGLAKGFAWFNDFGNGVPARILEIVLAVKLLQSVLTTMSVSKAIIPSLIGNIAGGGIAGGTLLGANAAANIASTTGVTVAGTGGAGIASALETGAVVGGGSILSRLFGKVRGKVPATNDTVAELKAQVDAIAEGKVVGDAAGAEAVAGSEAAAATNIAEQQSLFAAGETAAVTAKTAGTGAADLAVPAAILAQGKLKAGKFFKSLIGRKPIPATSVRATAEMVAEREAQIAAAETRNLSLAAGEVEAVVPASLALDEAVTTEAVAGAGFLGLGPVALGAGAAGLTLAGLSWQDSRRDKYATDQLKLIPNLTDPDLQKKLDDSRNAQGTFTFSWDHILGNPDDISRYENEMNKRRLVANREAFKSNSNVKPDLWTSLSDKGTSDEFKGLAKGSATKEGRAAIQDALDGKFQNLTDEDKKVLKDAGIDIDSGWFDAATRGVAGSIGKIFGDSGSGVDLNGVGANGFTESDLRSLAKASAGGSEIAKDLLNRVYNASTPEVQALAGRVTKEEGVDWRKQEAADNLTKFSEDTSLPLDVLTAKFQSGTASASEVETKLKAANQTLVELGKKSPDDPATQLALAQFQGKLQAFYASQAAYANSTAVQLYKQFSGASDTQVNDLEISQAAAILTDLSDKHSVAERQAAAATILQKKQEKYERFVQNGPDTIDPKTGKVIAADPRASSAITRYRRAISGEQPVTTAEERLGVNEAIFESVKASDDYRNFSQTLSGDIILNDGSKVPGYTGLDTTIANVLKNPNLKPSEIPGAIADALTTEAQARLKDSERYKGQATKQLDPSTSAQFNIGGDEKVSLRGGIPRKGDGPQGGETFIRRDADLFGKGGALEVMGKGFLGGWYGNAKDSKNDVFVGSSGRILTPDEAKKAVEQASQQGINVSGFGVSETEAGKSALGDVASAQALLNTAGLIRGGNIKSIAGLKSAIEGQVGALGADKVAALKAQADDLEFSGSQLRTYGIPKADLQVKIAGSYDQTANGALQVQIANLDVEAAKGKAVRDQGIYGDSDPQLAANNQIAIRQAETSAAAAQKAQQQHDEALQKAKVRNARSSAAQLVQAQKAPGSIEGIDAGIGEIDAQIKDARQDEQLAAARNDQDAVVAAKKAQADALVARVNADRTRRNALHEFAKAAQSLEQATVDFFGDKVLSAQEALKNANKELAYRLANPQDFTKGQIDESKAAVQQQANQTRQTIYSQQVDDINFGLEMRTLTKGQAINQLKGMQALYSNNKTISREIALKIRELQGSIDLQYNIPDKIKLPTLYEARRLNQIGGTNGVFGSSGGIGYQDNKNVTVNVVVQNGMSSDQIVGSLRQAMNGGVGTGVY